MLRNPKGYDLLTHLDKGMSVISVHLVAKSLTGLTNSSADPALLALLVSF